MGCTLRVMVLCGLMALGGAAEVASAAYPAPREGDWVVRDFRFDTGETLPELRLHYRTIGEPRRDAAGVVRNAVLIMHGTGGTGAQFLQPHFADELFGPGQPLDATRHFIILPDAIGHGRSSKPSDGLRMKFPRYTYADMVRAQHRLVTEHLGVGHLWLVMGTSMGGMHTWTAWNDGNYEQQPRLGLTAAIHISIMMSSVPLQWHALAHTRERADAFLAEQVKRRLETAEANDMLYQFDSSREYDPSTGLERIEAPLLAINSADDQINPPELGLMERLMPRVKRGTYVLVPISERTRGHSTHTWAAVWKADFVAFLARLPKVD